jgi:hypothetical protein
VPLHGAAIALPAVIAHGELNTSQAAALVQWYVDATSFNYSLDLAQQLTTSGLDSRAETGRTQAKANHLLKDGALSRFDDAIDALRLAGLSEDSLTRISADSAIGHADEAYEQRGS